MKKYSHPRKSGDLYSIRINYTDRHLRWNDDMIMLFETAIKSFYL